MRFQFHTDMWADCDLKLQGRICWLLSHRLSQQSAAKQIVCLLLSVIVPATAMPFARKVKRLCLIETQTRLRISLSQYCYETPSWLDYLLGMIALGQKDLDWFKPLSGGNRVGYNIYWSQNSVISLKVPRVYKFSSVVQSTIREIICSCTINNRNY